MVAEADESVGVQCNVVPCGCTGLEGDDSVGGGSELGHWSAESVDFEP